MNIPSSMLAVAAQGKGDDSSLVSETIPVPKPQPHDLLVHVAAAGVNRPDTLQRRGLYPPPPNAPSTPGLEVSGIVVALGENASKYAGGDRVCGLLPGGGYAQYALLHQDLALPVPNDLPLQHAAGIPETFFTAYSNLHYRGKLAKNDFLLVHGGASGIGTAAIPLGVAHGARVIAVVSSQQKADACRKLGAELVVNRNETNFLDAVLQHTNNHGADVILDMTVGENAQKNLLALAPDGRIVVIATLLGQVASIDFRLIMAKRAVITGSTLRPRPVAEKAQIAKDIRDHILPLIANKQIPLVVDSTYPLEKAQDAHVLMESGANIGKILLIPNNAPTT